MHIELTDHLRCPGDHAEAFLVLLPGTMNGRDVVAGDLGCPVCGWSVHWDNSIPDLGGGTTSAATTALNADALVALLGVSGPGGWVVLAGGIAALSTELAAALPGVTVVAVNPPAGVEADSSIQIIRSARWPVKRASMRGAAVGADAAEFAVDAIGSVLPGLRAVGEGMLPAGVDRDLVMAETAGAWVVQAK
jgi:hypothetical protein